MNDILLHSLLVIAGLTALYFGAEWLVRGAADIALILGLTPLVVGLTVVAFGTSAPEMFAGVLMNTAGKADMAAGNVVGSNICNIALMLGIAALLKPIAVHRQILTRDIPILLVASALFVWMLWNGEVGRVEGGILFAGIIVYVFLSFRFAKTGTDPEVAREIEEEVLSLDIDKPRKTKIVISILLVVLGLGVLIGGAESLIRGAEFLARQFGVSEAIIGLTLVAIGTSLPEIATSIVATIRNHGDIITGNAIGSCIFNLLAVIGVVALVKPMTGIAGVTRTDLVVMFGVLIFIIPFLFTRNRLGRFEGVILLVAYGLYCWSLSQR